MSNRLVSSECLQSLLSRGINAQNHELIATPATGQTASMQMLPAPNQTFMSGCKGDNRNITITAGEERNPSSSTSRRPDATAAAVTSQKSTQKQLVFKLPSFKQFIDVLKKRQSLSAQPQVTENNVKHITASSIAEEKIGQKLPIAPKTTSGGVMADHSYYMQALPNSKPPDYNDTKETTFNQASLDRIKMSFEAAQQRYARAKVAALLATPKTSHAASDSQKANQNNASMLLNRHTHLTRPIDKQHASQKELHSLTSAQSKNRHQTIIVTPSHGKVHQTKIIFSAPQTVTSTADVKNEITARSLDQSSNTSSTWLLPNATTIQEDLQKTLSLASFRPVSPLSSTPANRVTDEPAARKGVKQSVSAHFQADETGERKTKPTCKKKVRLMKKSDIERRDKKLTNKQRNRSKIFTNKVKVKFNFVPRSLKSTSGVSERFSRLKTLFKSGKRDSDKSQVNDEDQTPSQQADGEDAHNDTDVTDEKDDVTQSIESTPEKSSSTGHRDVSELSDFDVFEWLQSLTVAANDVIDGGDSSTCCGGDTEIYMKKRLSQDLQDAQAHGYTEDALNMLRDKSLYVWQLIEAIGA